MSEQGIIKIIPTEKSDFSWIEAPCWRCQEELTLMCADHGDVPQPETCHVCEWMKDKDSECPVCHGKKKLYMPLYS